MIIESTEKYLVAIYWLTQNSQIASTKAISESLGYRESSVTRKVQALAKSSHLIYEYRRGVSLTKEGEQVALLGIRKLGLLETFLVGVLNYPPERATIEASHMEYATSNLFVDRIEELLKRLDIELNTGSGFYLGGNRTFQELQTVNKNNSR